ncbi:MAG TPA: GDSL-type esterase/lipase family protein, partial [Dissulfurispiraceae bacterium]|nr:GDSL-type esterase/lipase family protein [Dissulfurispiraceae bacterium]
AAEAMSGKQTIVFIGDSLTEFFDWQERFPAYKVFNLGIAGETVEGLLGRMEGIRRVIRNAGREPDIIFVMTGINNVAMEDYEILGSYKKALTALIAAFGKSKLVIQSILPVRLPWTDNTIIRQLNESLKGMAGDLKVEYLDLYNIFFSPGSEAKKEYLLEDGVHISGEGYGAWSAAVEDYLKSLL